MHIMDNLIKLQHVNVGFQTTLIFHKFFYWPASLIASDISIPGHTCSRGGGLAPAPTTSSKVNKVNQSWLVWIFAAFVLRSSWRAYEICLVHEWITAGFIIKRMRRDVRTCGATSSLRNSLMARRRSPTTARSTKNVHSLELTIKLYKWSLTFCHTGTTRSLKTKKQQIIK